MAEHDYIIRFNHTVNIIIFIELGDNEKEIPDIIEKLIKSTYKLHFLNFLCNFTLG